MTTLHEQARAEAEKRYQVLPIQSISEDTGRVQTGDLNVPYRDAFEKGFLAGHEAATRTRVVTTVTELDALPVGTVLLDRIGRAMQVGLDSEGDRLVRRAGSNDAYYIGIDRISLPARVLYEPEETR